MRQTHRRAVPLAVALALCTAACLDDRGRGPTGGAGDTEADAADALQPADSSGGDTQADLPAGETGGDDARGPCTPVLQGDMPEPPAPPRKFALSMYHFNIQYVAGGTEGMTGRSEVDFSNDELEDRIVEQSFEPLLDVLLDHPGWGVDVEMQGYMIDVMRQRHPGVIGKMQTLVERGQIHVNTFHWSDQLWIAHDLRSMLRSQALALRSLEEACLPLGAAVFTQEGQFAEGMIRVLDQDGRVAVLPTNLFRYHYGNDQPPLLYEHEGMPVLVGGRGITQGEGEEQIQVTWHFFDDGEKELTGDLDPYFGEYFAFDPASAERLVQELTELESQGFHVTTVGDYLDHLDELGVEPEPMPPIIDGTWQPGESHNTFTWMGGTGLWGPDERDNELLTTLSRGGRLLAALDTLVPWAATWAAEPSDAAAWSAELEGIWRAQLLGQVSDGTGWNPWAGEVQYALDHGQEAIQRGEALWDEIKEARGAITFLVDPATGTVEQDILFEAPSPPVPVDAPMEVTTAGFGWEGEVQWFEDPDRGVLFVDVSFSAGAVVDFDVWVDFPRGEEQLIYAPVGREDEGIIRRIDLEGLDTDGTGDVGCALANGLVGLGGSAWLIKDKATVHLSVLLPLDEPVIRFRSKAVQAKEPFTWRFYYLEDATEEEALAFADRLNVNPVAYR